MLHLRAARMRRDATAAQQIMERLDTLMHKLARWQERCRTNAGRIMLGCTDDMATDLRFNLARCGKDHQAARTTLQQLLALRGRILRPRSFTGFTAEMPPETRLQREEDADGASSPSPGTAIIDKLGAAHPPRRVERDVSGTSTASGTSTVSRTWSDNLSDVVTFGSPLPSAGEEDSGPGRTSDATEPSQHLSKHVATSWGVVERFLREFYQHDNRDTGTSHWCKDHNRRASCTSRAPRPRRALAWTLC